MTHIAEVVVSADFWKIAFPALAAVAAWFLNERSKIGWEQFKRREESYKELLRCLRGFYISTFDPKLTQEFLHQTNLLWLYAPDDVIRAAYGFLQTVQTGMSCPPQESERAAGKLVEAVRRDLLRRKVLRRSALVGSEFRHITAAQAAEHGVAPNDRSPSAPARR